MTDPAQPAPRERHGERLDIRPAWHVGPFDADMPSDVLLLSADAQTTTTDVDMWLRAHR